LTGCSSGISWASVTQKRSICWASHPRATDFPPLDDRAPGGHFNASDRMLELTGGRVGLGAL
jgi:hypothetical protein